MFVTLQVDGNANILSNDLVNSISFTIIDVDPSLYLPISLSTILSSMIEIEGLVIGMMKNGRTYRALHLLPMLEFLGPVAIIFNYNFGKHGLVVHIYD